MALATAMNGESIETQTQTQTQEQVAGEMAAVAAEAPAAEQSAAAPTEQKTTIKALILSKDVGALIGKGGATIRDMREQTGCRIIISESIPHVHERVLTVIGPLEAVSRAYQLIAQHIEQEAKNSEVPNLKVFINLLVPNQQTGAIIGKGGSRIKEIRENSGAQISVATDSLPQSSERLVTVMGTAEAMGKAIADIINILNENPARGTVIPFRPRVRLEQMQYGAHQQWPGTYGYQEAHGAHQAGYGYHHGMASAHTQRPNQYVPREGQTSQVVPVPNDYVGAIIGKAGAKINEIRQLSQTHIQIQEPQAGTTERHIIITGTAEGCQHASYLISARVQEEMTRRTAQQQIA